jgi:hypothetical protein
MSGVICPPARRWLISACTTRLGFLGDGRAQVKLAADALAQCAHAPALDAAHFGVILALQRLLERQDFDEVAPAQFSRQRRDNLFV